MRILREVGQQVRGDLIHNGSCENEGGTEVEGKEEECQTEKSHVGEFRFD